MATAAEFKQAHFLHTPSKGSSVKGEFLKDVFLLSGSEESCPKGHGETFAYTGNTTDAATPKPAEQTLYVLFCHAEHSLAHSFIMQY